MYLKRPVNHYYISLYLCGFAKPWLKKFQVHFNNLTSKSNGKQLKVISLKLNTMTISLLATDDKSFSRRSNSIMRWKKQDLKRPEIMTF